MAARSARGCRATLDPSELCHRGVSHILSLLARVAVDLDQIGHPWALVGGLAVGARARPRFTQDIDLAVAVDSDHSAERVVAALRKRDYELDTLLEQEQRGRIGTVRMLPPGAATNSLLVDLLFAACGVEVEIAAAAERMRLVRDLDLPVARTGHLVAMKLLSHDQQRRPADLDDLRVLVEACDARELERARTAVRAIVERGFHRGRDLEGDLDAWIQRRTATP